MNKRKLPEKIEQMLNYYRTFTCPEIPEFPVVGKWYRYSPQNCVCSQGSPYHATVRIGKTNNFAIVLCGGGVSLNEYTAARPISFDRYDEKENFYSNESDFLTDALSSHGLGNSQENNPFKDWSMVVISYSSGDFHCGAGDFNYKNLDGENAVLHHHGYINFKAVISKIKTLINTPEKILITGFSAGAFGTSLLTDDVIEMFPDCKNFTCCIDSALILYDDWHNVAKNVWHSPKHIYERLCSNNITLDSVLALYHKRGDLVKYLFMSSYRDIELTRFQSFIDSGNFDVTKKDGDIYTKNLKKMCDELKDKIPNIGLYIFDGKLPESVAPIEYGLTEHCVIMSDNVFTKESDGVKALEWLFEGVNGNISSCGLSLLED